MNWRSTVETHTAAFGGVPNCSLVNQTRRLTAIQTIDYKFRSRRGCCISATVAVAIGTSDANRISINGSKVCSNNILAGER